MFDTLAAAVPAPRGLPDRAHRLEVLRRVLDGTIYDVLPHQFHDERNPVGEYVPLRSRRPSVRYGLCKLVVDDSVSFLFGEGRFPAVECADKPTQAHLQDVLADARAMDVFSAAAQAGSTGSACILFRVLHGRVFLDGLPTWCLTPEWEPDAPDTLRAVHEAYQVTGATLRAAGYAVPDPMLASWHWFRRSWTAMEETWFVPQPADLPRTRRQRAAPVPAPVRDDARSVRHGLGFVPLVWVRNLPGGTEPDGACTFRAAVETGIEIDYQLSQAGRGLKYSSDPTLLIKEPAAAESGEIVRSASDALVVSKEGDAKLLEINGTAAAAVIEYVRALREMALESVHGNRASADRLGAAQSGRAMELLYAPLLNLVDKLRSSYGRALLDVARMVTRASALYPLAVEGGRVPDLSAAGRLTLRWPPYFPPTHGDAQAEAATLALLRREGLLSRDTAVHRVAATHDIGDPQGELAKIAQDEAAADARAKARGDDIQDRQPLPA